MFIIEWDEIFFLVYIEYLTSLYVLVLNQNMINNTNNKNKLGYDKIIKKEKKNDYDYYLAIYMLYVIW